MLNHLLVVVALHEVGDACTATWVEHLLTRLGILCHHLMVGVVLLLLELVVKRLELAVLRHGSAAKDIVNVLTNLDFWAEAVVI